jgi:nuclear factor related to kappa-B-binding protein
MDGGLSMVAGIRGAGKGKSKGKAREHFMLKSDRPPEVTILCLVRDAASRFFEGVGTRADVCSLIRESRYINEEVPENQLNNVSRRQLSGRLRFDS